MINEEVSPRSRLVAAVLCFLFGVVGAHRFYVGKTGTGILMIFTVGGLGFWAMIDLILILFGVFRDVEGRRVFEWSEQHANVRDLTARIEEIERRLTDIQDIVIALDDRIKRNQAARP
jgi:hypothetical protein